MKRIRILEFAAFLALAGIGAWLAFTRPMDDRLDVMLPQNPELVQSLQLLDDTKAAGKIILHVRQTSSNITHEAFVAALDRLVGALRSPQIANVITPATTMPDPAEIRALATYAPQLLPASTYPELERRISEEGITEALKRMRRTMMSPQSVGFSDWFRSDPFGARATALEPLQTLGRSMGYRMVMRDGHFFSEDLTAAMIILETPVRITDHAGSQALIAFLREHLTRLPQGLDATIIAGHLHTLSNQRIIRRDIGWTSALATIFFVAFFLISFRDGRSVLIFLIPPVGILMGLAVVGATGKPIAAIVVGMGAMLAGIAIDYGTHTYVALVHRRPGQTRGDAVRGILRPLTLGMLTTVAPLVAFLFSSIPGYRQIGLLAISSLFFALLLAVRVLPLFFPATVIAQAAHTASDTPSPPRRGASPRAIALLHGLLLAAGLAVAVGVTVDFNFARLDGTEPDIVKDEKEFFERWGGGQGAMGMLAVWDADPETARQANDAIYERVRAVPSAATSFFSLAPVWPAEKTRRERAARWVQFWDDHGSNVQTRLDRLAPAHGFATNAFTPFFSTLHEGTDPSVFAPGNALVATLERQFVRADEGRFMLLSFFSDTAAVSDAVGALGVQKASHAIVSRHELQKLFFSSVTQDLKRQALMGIAILVLVVALLVRNVRAMLVVGLPPVAGVIGLLAGLRLAGQPLTPIGFMALLLVAGNCIDYGAFMLEAHRRKDAHRSFGRAVDLAWVTTLGGAAVLLAAQHPVLYAVGLATSIGCTCGYLSARWGLASVAQVLGVPKDA